MATSGLCGGTLNSCPSSVLSPDTRGEEARAISVGGKLLSVWLFDAVGRGDLGGVGSQCGVRGSHGDGHTGGGAGESQEGDRLHPQQAREGHGAVVGAQNMRRSEGAHGGHGGSRRGGWGGLLGEGHVEVDWSSHGGGLGCGFGCL